MLEARAGALRLSAAEHILSADSFGTQYQRFSKSPTMIKSFTIVPTLIVRHVHWLLVPRVRIHYSVGSPFRDGHLQDS